MNNGIQTTVTKYGNEQQPKNEPSAKNTSCVDIARQIRPNSVVYNYLSVLLRHYKYVLGIYYSNRCKLISTRGLVRFRFPTDNSSSSFVRHHYIIYIYIYVTNGFDPSAVNLKRNRVSPYHKRGRRIVSITNRQSRMTTARS